MAFKSIMLRSNELPLGTGFYHPSEENTISSVSSSSSSSSSSTTSWSSTAATLSSSSTPLNNSGLFQTIQSMFDDPTIRTLTCVLLINIALILIIITVI